MGSIQGLSVITYYGLSSDTKPVVPNGSCWYETDTNKFWARINGTWKVVNETALEYEIYNSGSPIVAGEYGRTEVPFDCTIISARLFADQVGSIVIDIWKSTYAGWPPTVANTIVASAKPTLSSASKSQDTTLTGWSKTLLAGDVLKYKVDSATTVQSVLLSLGVRIQ